MYPVVGEEYEDMVRSGYVAFMAWDGSYNKKVGYRKPNYQALYVLWILKVLEHFILTWMRFIWVQATSPFRILWAVLVGLMSGKTRKSVVAPPPSESIGKKEESAGGKRRQGVRTKVTDDKNAISREKVSNNRKSPRRAKKGIEM